jgi:hypothetical protein
MTSATADTTDRTAIAGEVGAPVPDAAARVAAGLPPVSLLAVAAPPTGPVWAALLVAAALSLTACSGGSTAAPPARAPEPALRPTGPTARDVTYRCRDGTHGTLLVSVPDARRLAETINPIDLCELDQGLTEIELVIGCTSASPGRAVRVVAVEGRLPTATATALCRP